MIGHQAHPETKGQGPLILFVEDEPMLLMLYEDAAADVGARWRSASSVGEAMASVSPDVDVAVLDIRLGEERVFSVAYKLIEVGIPFLFCSGTTSDMPDGDFDNVPVINKPARASQVIEKALNLS